jgi:hypothetical protein
MILEREKFTLGVVIFLDPLVLLFTANRNTNVVAVKTKRGRKMSRG